jgi:hypothetical protein
MFAIVITATALARAEGSSMDFARVDGEAISFGEIEKLIGAGVHSGVDLYDLNEGARAVYDAAARHLYRR